ncbi:MAG: tRNA (adenosine(37)-N6)-dimethylallyltransferase MiaA [Gemmatimonadaceae bacterium]|nr:tRNA (adenosine(37)-N6)-dimethylallyltransferase MiaA [Gemmatimonadaceae bacterium]
MTDVDGASLITPVIIGPTAAGKSAIALHLASTYGLSIISADSRQVYAGFNIGTAKPSADEQRLIPHYGIDVLAPIARYSAHEWARDAERWGRESRAQGRMPVVVGGTGFYVRALVDPLDDTPSLEPSRRAALGSWLATLDAETLERWCRRLDPARAALGRTQRLRAVETALLAGRRISEWSVGNADVEATAASSRPLARQARYLVVDPGPALATRIAGRVAAMVADGWFDEVRALMDYVPADAPAWQASGYARVRDAVAGVIPPAEAVERVIIETRQYAKRQRTWCRHQLPGAQVTRVDSSAPDALALARAWWESDDGSAT